MLYSRKDPTPRFQSLSQWWPWMRTFPCLPVTADPPWMDFSSAGSPPFFSLGAQWWPHNHTWWLWGLSEMILWATQGLLIGDSGADSAAGRHVREGTGPVGWVLSSSLFSHSSTFIYAVCWGLAKMSFEQRFWRTKEKSRKTTGTVLLKDFIEKASKM